MTEPFRQFAKHVNYRNPKILKHANNTPQLGMGVYTPPDISLILRIPIQRVRWYINEVWDNQFGRKFFGERYSWDMDHQKAVNFLVLAEFQMVLELRKIGLSTRRILKAREAIATDLRTPYPFATSTILAHPHRIWHKLGELAINADVSHQLNFLSCVERFCKKIDFEENNNLAKRLWPDGRQSSVVIDPKHQLGQPIIDGTNITAETLYRMNKAGDSVDVLSRIYNIPVNKVEDAVRFYNRD